MSAANPQEFIHWNQNLKILFKTKPKIIVRGVAQKVSAIIDNRGVAKV